MRARSRGLRHPALGLLALFPLLWNGSSATSAPAPADSSGRNLVVLVFRDSPTQGLEITGGLLGVPDSTGRFPSTIMRYDPVTGNHAPPGSAADGCLVFADLRPGAYRVALIHLRESGAVHRFLTQKAPRRFEEACRVYCDSLPALTFSVGAGEIRFLGRLTRRLRPSLDSGELWQSSFEWSPGDEYRTLKGLMKRKDMAGWKDLLQRRVAGIDSTRRKSS